MKKKQKYSQTMILGPSTSLSLSISVRESLWTEIRYYIVFRLTATLDIPLHTSTYIAVHKQWAYISVWLYLQSMA
jgi:hypothetical protein